MDELYCSPKHESDTTYIFQLRKREQTIIRNALIKRGILGDDLRRGMDGRVCDLEDTLPINKILANIREEHER